MNMGGHGVYRVSESLVYCMLRRCIHTNIYTYMYIYIIVYVYVYGWSRCV